MRTTQTMTVSLPPAIVEEFERVRKAESRTRSELVREALRVYFSSRYPVVSASKAELAAIRRGRAAFARGDFISLSELLDALESASHRPGAKKPPKAAATRPSSR